MVRCFGVLVGNTSDASGSAADIFRPSYVYAPISCVGIVVNFFVAAVVVRRKFVPGDLPRLLLTSQMVSDALASLANALSWIVGTDLDVPNNALGTFLCKVWFTRTVFWTLVQISVINLVMFNVERYMCVVHPIYYRRFANRRKALTLISVAWVLGIVLESPSYFGAERDGSRCKFVEPNQGIETLIGSMVLVTNFVLPLSVLLICNVQVVLVLKSKQKELGMMRVSSARLHAAQQLTYTALAIGIAYTTFIAPHSFVFFLYSIDVLEDDYNDLCYEGTRLLVNVYFIFNALLYVATMRSLRKELSRLFCCVTRLGPSNGVVSTIDSQLPTVTQVNGLDPVASPLP